MLKNKPKRKCPHCNSTRLLINKYTKSIKCKKCGYINDKTK
jgi:ribosomal protein S27AE